jgi:hypothetical protein
VCTAAPVLIPYLVLSLVSQEFTISHALSVSMKMLLLMRMMDLFSAEYYWDLG